MSKIPVDLEQGEVFFRLSLDSDGITCFTCGMYPDEESEEINNNEILALFMAGIVSMFKSDVDHILNEGARYLAEGNQPFDFIVGDEDHEFFGDLTEEQLQLLYMETKGEA